MYAITPCTRSAPSFARPAIGAACIALGLLLMSAAGPVEAHGRHGGHGPGYSGHHASGHWGHGHRHARRWRGGVSIGIGIGSGGYGYGGSGWGPGGWYPGYGLVFPVPPPVVYLDRPRAERPPPPLAKGPPDPVFDPLRGQSAAETEADLHDCNRWALGQPQAIARADVFHRATLACMQDRDYAVR